MEIILQMKISLEDMHVLDYLVWQMLEEIQMVVNFLLH